MMQQIKPQWQAIIMLSTLAPLYYLSYKLHPTYQSLNKKSKSAHTPEAFTEQWLRTHLLEPYNPAAIQAYCNTTTWRPNLIFNLQDANGGIGNVRASMLDFLFYAIEAGASVVLPGMSVRSTTDLFDVWGGAHANFSRFFDEDWFKTSMSEACPQLRIYDPPADGNLSHLAERVIEGQWQPQVPKSRRHQSRASWLVQMNSWMQGHGLNAEQLTLVNLGRTMWEVDTRALPAAFRLNFPMLLRTRLDIRRYASIAMTNLAWEHGVHLNPSDRLHKRAFYGAHLRTESDTVSAGWFVDGGQLEAGANWTAQTDNYVKQAVKNDLFTIFAASGNATDVARFRFKAAANAPPLAVRTKWELLSVEEGATLAKLEWDQQALVDLEILMRCSVFGGFAKSSFAFAIAVARNAWAEGYGKVTDPWFVSHVDQNVAYDDGLSRIIGRNQLNEEKVPRGAWPG